MVQPRLNGKKGFDDLHILFCYDGIVQAGEAFQPNHFVPLLFYTHQQKRKSAAVAQVSKRRKLAPTFSKKVSKKPDINISSFFKPTVIPTFHKAPNETFSSSATLRAHQNIDKPDGDISVNKRKPESITTSILNILMLLCIEINVKVWVLLSFVV